MRLKIDRPGPMFGHLWVIFLTYLSNIMKEDNSRDLNQLTLITQLRYNHD